MIIAIPRQIFWRCLIISTLLAASLYGYIVYADSGFLPSLKERWIELVFTILSGNVMGIGLVIFSQYLNNKWLSKKEQHNRFLFSLCGNILLGSTLFALGFRIYYEIFQIQYTLSSFIDAYHDIILKSFIILFLVILLYTIADFAIFGYKKYIQVQLESSQIMRQQLTLQFDALKSQISPHFLFNSLNTISSLLYRDVRQAEKFIRNLATTYLSVITNHNKQIIPLQDELIMVEAYGYLMSVRFENAFEIHINIPENCVNARIPPLSVQMLVENAIKHNHLSEERPLQIEIYTDKDYLVVRNNYIGKPNYLNVDNSLIQHPDKRKTPGFGLINIKERYKFLTRKEVKIEKDQYFTVRIPLLQAGS